ncbi:hypothetical protein PAHAL_9G330600 [Panicum hallii]|uniref:Uncharacterized protein n=1 Tax=Panicum hallii TaxID=206008 RepID=A0A2T8I3B0_9POAL|nr:hypothetical protein PAHAL_9G330600 [Panicum hallii]
MEEEKREGERGGGTRRRRSRRRPRPVGHARAGFARCTRSAGANRGGRSRVSDKPSSDAERNSNPPSTTAPPEPRWLFPCVPRCPAVCPSRSSPPLAIAVTRSAQPPAPYRSHALLPGRLPPYLLLLPSSAHATPTPPLPELRRGRHATHAVDP